jgi:hypothetical protein
MPAIEKNGNVVVPVQEDKWLLVNNDKEGINQLTAETTTKGQQKEHRRTRKQHAQQTQYSLTETC